jgi:hypothetical protein
MTEENTQLEMLPKSYKVFKKKANLPDFNPLPWERQKGESGKAYEAFCVFRDIKPTDRTIVKVSDTISKSLPMLYKWKTVWQWDKRVLQFDAFMQQNAMMDYQRKIREMNNRHIKIAYGFQVKVAQALEQTDVAKLADNPAEMLRWFQVASDLERKAMNQPTEIIRQEQLNVNVNMPQNESECATLTERENRLARIISALKEVGAIEEQGIVIEGSLRDVGTESGTSEAGASDDSKDVEVHPSSADRKADSVPPT